MRIERKTWLREISEVELLPLRLCEAGEQQRRDKMADTSTLDDCVAGNSLSWDRGAGRENSSVQKDKEFSLGRASFRKHAAMSC